MSHGRWVWVGAMSLLLGCSGKFEVGKISDVPGAGTGGALSGGNTSTGGDTSTGGNTSNGGASTGGDTFTGGTFVGYGGSLNSGAGMGYSAGNANVSYAGDSGQAPSPTGTYCGAALPTQHETQFANPQIVWVRIQQFLLGTVGQIPQLPEVTTREWAARQAMIALDSVGTDPAPGLVRFVAGWLPGAERADLWASILGGPSSLSELLTTDQGLLHGAGVLTDPVILKQRTLVARGRFILDFVMCSQVPEPPPNVPPLEPQPPGVTRRMLFAAHEANPVCAACHHVIDPYGIALEHFTPVTGLYSDFDNGIPIDSSTSTTTTTGSTIKFTDAAGLGAALANTCEVPSCLVKRLLADAESSAQLPIPGSTDPAAIAEIAYASSRSGNELRALIWYLVQSDTFLRAF